MGTPFCHENEDDQFFCVVTNEGKAFLLGKKKKVPESQKGDRLSRIFKHKVTQATAMLVLKLPLFVTRV